MDNFHDLIYASLAAIHIYHAARRYVRGRVSDHFLQDTPDGVRRDKIQACVTWTVVSAESLRFEV